MKQYQEGDLASIWYREGPKKRWQVEFGFVILLLVGPDRILFQTSETGNLHARSGPTSAALKGDGFERKIFEPMIWNVGGLVPVSKSARTLRVFSENA